MRKESAVNSVNRLAISKWLAAAVLAILVGVVLLFVLRPNAEDAATGDAETRIIAYLKENVRPGQPVLVTELYNNVFTSTEDREALQRLYDTFFSIPASAAEIYTKTGKIPTLEELSGHFQFKIPGEMEVLLRAMESDPRVPRFFERDPATGEITSIDVDRIASDERFGRPLRNR
ncbi:MAG: hypothetical protein HY646_05800 [Acidobacteria bacterium]|nr:hypothetical protein [Acidobacteriota bacterium]